MSQLIPFSFDDTPVRVHVDDNGTPWWVVVDVCHVLGLTNPSEVAKRLPGDGLRKTEVVDTHGQLQVYIVVNEPGLYELIFRSNKPEAKRFRHWVFSEVLPQIRKTGSYAPPPAPTPVLPPVPIQQQIDDLKTAVEFLRDLGQLTPRDELMYADMTRNVSLSGQGLLTTGHTPSAHGFSLAERVEQLGYRLNRKQQTAYIPILGKKVAAEYRKQHGKEPRKEARYVDGATRPISWFHDDDAAWIDPLIQGYLAGMLP